MFRGPDAQNIHIQKPLNDMSSKDLRDLANTVESTVAHSLSDVLAELTYREQRCLSKWVAVLIAGTLLANIAGVVVNAILVLR